jgi:hypothetical protein
LDQGRPFFILEWVSMDKKYSTVKEYFVNVFSLEGMAYNKSEDILRHPISGIESRYPISII